MKYDISIYDASKGGRRTIIENIYYFARIIVLVYDFVEKINKKK